MGLRDEGLSIGLNNLGPLHLKEEGNECGGEGHKIVCMNFGFVRLAVLSVNGTTYIETVGSFYMICFGDGS